MREALASFLIGLLLGACSAHTTPAAVAPFSSSDLATDISSKTVALVTTFADGEQIPYCSGVWVSGVTFVTAFHCVADNKTAWVSYASRADVYGSSALAPLDGVILRPGFVQATDEPHDLALVRALAVPLGHGVALPHIGPIAQGSYSAAMGHSMRLWWSYSSGDVAAVRVIRDLDADLDPATLWVQSNAHMSAGNSGGGLFDSDGQLLGIAHAFISGGQSLNLFVHAQHVEALTKR